MCWFETQHIFEILLWLVASQGPRIISTAWCPDLIPLRHVAQIRYVSHLSTEQTCMESEIFISDMCHTCKKNQLQALGSVKRLETIVLLWRYINKIEWNWIELNKLAWNQISSYADMCRIYTWYWIRIAHAKLGKCPDCDPNVIFATVVWRVLSV